MANLKEIIGDPPPANQPDPEALREAEAWTEPPEQVLDGTIHTEVDGAPAVIDPREPTFPKLIEVSLESLVHDLVVQDRHIATVVDDMDDCKERLKKAKEKREVIVDAIKGRDPGTVFSSVAEPLPFDADEPQGEEVDED